MTAILAQLRGWLPPGPIISWRAELDLPTPEQDPTPDA
jgi:hypothetical protein